MISTNILEEIEILKAGSENPAVKETLNSLFVSWQQEYPGQSQPAFFFLSKGYRRTVVRELLAKDTRICQRRGEWERYLRINGSQNRNKAIPYWYETASWSEITRSKCEKCQLPQPVIEYAFKKNAAPEKKWVKKFFILCLNCQSLNRTKTTFPYII